VPMDRSSQTSVDEIADQVFRLSTWVPDISEQGFTFNQFLLTGDQPFSVPLRYAAAFSVGFSGHREGDPNGTTALDLIRPRRGRRVRGNEPAAGRRTTRRGHSRSLGLHALGERPVRPASHCR